MSGVRRGEGSGVRGIGVSGDDVRGWMRMCVRGCVGEWMRGLCMYIGRMCL